MNNQKTAVDKPAQWFVDAVVGVLENARDQIEGLGSGGHVAMTVAEIGLGVVPGADSCLNAGKLLYSLVEYVRARKLIADDPDRMRNTMEHLSPAKAGDLSARIDEVITQRFPRLPRNYRDQLKHYVLAAQQYASARTRTLTAELRSHGRQQQVFNLANLASFFPAECTVLAGRTALPGTDVAIIELVGMGGFGEVYRARRSHAGADEALKVCRDPEHAPLFRREIAALRKLKADVGATEPVVDLRDSGEWAGRPWLLMEFVPDGRTLHTWRESLAHGRATPAIALEMLHKVATALAAVHTTGTIHGDLKPTNVLLTPDNCPKLSDFALARLDLANEHTLTQAGSRPATHAYTSHERDDDGQPSMVDDVFALGVILVELLLGKPRAKTAQLDDDLRKHGVPRDVRRLVTKLIASQGQRAKDGSAALVAIEATRVWRLRFAGKWAEGFWRGAGSLRATFADYLAGRTMRLTFSVDVKGMAPGLLIFSVVAIGFAAFAYHIEQRKADHATEAACIGGDGNACRIAQACRTTGDCALQVDTVAADRFAVLALNADCESHVTDACRKVLGYYERGDTAKVKVSMAEYTVRALGCEAGAREMCTSPVPQSESARTAADRKSQPQAGSLTPTVADAAATGEAAADDVGKKAGTSGAPRKRRGGQDGQYGAAGVTEQSSPTTSNAPLPDCPNAAAIAAGWQDFVQQCRAGVAMDEGARVVVSAHWRAASGWLVMSRAIGEVPGRVRDCVEARVKVSLDESGGVAGVAPNQGCRVKQLAGQ